MRTAWLIGRKVAHFVAVLFLSSLVLGVLLWLSPGSPGKARDPVPFDKTPVGSRVCVDARTCGILAVAPRALAGGVELPGTGDVVDVAIDGNTRTIRADTALLPGPGFLEWFVVRFWVGALRGDLGPAYSGEPVLSLVSFAAKQTLPIVFGALLLSLLGSLGLVAFLTWLPFPSMRGVLRTLVLAASIAPVFVVGYLLTKAGVLPHPVKWWVAPGACVLLLALADSNLGEIMLGLETEFRQLRNQDYVHAAGLRGASLFFHMLPGMILPLSSLSAAKVAFLLGSVVIAENVYAVQGLGTLSLKAATKPDPLLLLTITVFITGIVAAVALARDVLDILVDPRVRRAAEDPA
jgi:ABC-type dipeptide/oligopeptide/nickel transport system permease component